MCLLIGTKKGVQVPNEHLNNGWTRNSDGGGYSFLRNDVLVTKKFRNKTKFLKQYKLDFDNNKESKFIVHFRLATDGTNKGVTNVHPFNVNKNLVFAHNGIISNVGEDKILSDTQLFNNNILKNMQTDFLSYKGNKKLISDFIGHSKLVFLNTRNQMTIINEHLGDWLNGIWYSNDSYKTKKSYCGVGSYGGITEYYSKFNNNKVKINKPEGCEFCFSKSKNLSLDLESDLWVCDECVDYWNEPQQENQINFFD